MVHRTVRAHQEGMDEEEEGKNRKLRKMEEREVEEEEIERKMKWTPILTAHGHLK